MSNVKQADVYFSDGLGGKELVISIPRDVAGETLNINNRYPISKKGKVSTVCMQDLFKLFNKHIQVNFMGILVRVCELNEPK